MICTHMIHVLIVTPWNSEQRTLFVTASDRGVAMYGVGRENSRYVVLCNRRLEG